MFGWPIPFERSLFIFGLLAASAPAQAAGQKDASGPALRLLASQNAERASLGLSPLRWDPALEVAAKNYAAELAVSGKWQHSSEEARVGQGENLWMGTHGAFSDDEMVGAWLAERSMFQPGTFPSVSRTGNWEDVGHYTQIIWRGDRSVGCALSSSARFDYLVCRYATPGNVMGETVMQSEQLASSR